MGLFGLDIPITVYHCGKSGWELEAGTEAETMEDHAYWLVPHGFLNLFSSVTQNRCPEVALFTVTWALPYQSLMNKIPHRLVYSPV